MHIFKNESVTHQASKTLTREGTKMIETNLLSGKILKNQVNTQKNIYWSLRGTKMWLPITYDYEIINSE